jgi:hypothetical protein
LPEFRIVQHSRDEAVLNQMLRFFRAGKVVVNHGSRKELRIRRLDDLKVVAAFFKKHPLKTKKRNDCELFEQVLLAMDNGDHLNHEGLEKIARICWRMNRKVKPRYLESSETIRQKSLLSD